MSDIFISYASADRPRAAQVAQALQARGWSVWWDRAIPPGRQFDEVIEEALDAAHCVVVLWSKTSTASSWVKTEAAEAMRRTVLIPALIDPDARIPLEFRRLQAADLARWNGVDATPEFEQFCEAIAREIARNPAPPEPGPRPGPAPAPAPAHSTSPTPTPRPSPPEPPRPTPSPPHDGGSALPPAPHPEPAPAPPATPKSRKALWIGIGVGGVLVLAAIGSMFDQPRPGSGPLPMPSSPMPPAPMTRGIEMNVQWRDYVLQYDGHVSWDGVSNHAAISANVRDGNTGLSLGSRQLQAIVAPLPGDQVVFSTSVPVPGDSRTPGYHVHAVNLIFEGQGSGWRFLRNCMTPQQCF